MGRLAKNLPIKKGKCSNNNQTEIKICAFAVSTSSYKEGGAAAC
jgi:hypothetical protein